jgi:hypothetical protein
MESQYGGLPVSALEEMVTQAAGVDADGHPKEPKQRFTLRKPNEFLEMRFDDSDIILGQRLLAVGQPLVIAAAGGTGKSRLSLQAAGAIVSGRKFLAFDTGGTHLRWLILQTENSNRRIQHDLAKLRDWLGADWEKFNEQVTIHAVENDIDGFVSLDNPENIANIEGAIAEAKPDIIVVDPLNEFAIGDLNSDVGMKTTLQMLQRVCRRGNPNRAIIVLHHAITGRSGAAKAIGFDRASFARNSKTLHSWTRGQINLAPVDPDSNDRLIVACGKCSNGPEFQTFAIRLNPSTMIYECDPTVDVAQWEKEISGNTNKEPLMTLDRVRELCRPAIAKAALAKAIMEDCGCARGSAYRYIARTAASGKIRHDKDNDTYFKK